MPTEARRYPGVDIEPLMFQALYLAAFTWLPDGGANFWGWYIFKVRTTTRSVRRQFENRARGLLDYGNVKAGCERRRGPPIRVTSLDTRSLDERRYYRDREPED